MKLRFIISALFVSGIAFAFMPPVMAQAQKTRMVNLCQKVLPYLPDNEESIVPADGGAYEDAVDVNGDAVVPANLGGKRGVYESMFDSVSIPVELDLAEYFNRPEIEYAPGLSFKPDIINIEISGDGRVFFNGYDISKDIYTACSVTASGQVDLPVTAPEQSSIRTPPDAKAKNPVDLPSGNTQDSTIKNENANVEGEAEQIDGSYP